MRRAKFRWSIATVIRPEEQVAGDGGGKNIILQKLLAINFDIIFLNTLLIYSL
jgi:hypothetical protein